MIQNQLYDGLERLNALLRVEARKAGAEHGLQPIQLEVLHYLSICNRYSDTPMALTDYLGQTKGTVSQTLKVLENKNLLSKHADADDKRVAHLMLTAQGQALINRLIPSPAFSSACEGLSERRQADLQMSLKALLRSILAQNGMKTFGACRTCRFHQSVDAEHAFCQLVEQPLLSNEFDRICREHEHTS